MRGAACSLLAALALGLAGCAAHRPQEPPRPPLDTSTSGAIPSTGTPAETGGSTVFVAVALSMVGEPYRWGGAEPGGFDCSGLVVYAGRRAGLERAVHLAGEERLGLGDQDAVAHLHRAVDAEHFVHAPSSGGAVRVDSLEVRPYVNALLQARRLSFPH